MRGEAKRSSHHIINRCQSQARHIYNRMTKTGNLSPHIKTYVHLFMHIITTGMRVNHRVFGIHI